jgi:hypothetical protein
MEEGKRAFKAGVLFLQDPDGAKYDEALVEFRRAYKALGTWKVLGNVGLCALKLERDGEAIEAYEKYLAGGGTEIEKEEREQVERDLLRLRTQLVKVHLEGVAGAQVSDERTTTQGARVVNLYPLSAATADLGLHPGHHVVSAKLGDQQARWEVDLSPASSVTHKFDYSSAPTAGVAGAMAGGSEVSVQKSGGSMRTIGFVAGGVGLVGVGLGTLFAIQRSNKVSDSQALCTGPNGSCPDSKKPAIDSLDDEAKKNGTLSVVGFAVGGAALVTGVTLIVMGGKSKSSTAESDAPRVQPWVGFGSAGFLGKF